MTAADLRAWLTARDLSIREAAPLFALSYRGLQDQLGGRRPVSAQTARIADLLVVTIPPLTDPRSPQP